MWATLLTRWLARLTLLAEPTSTKHIAGFHVMVTQGMLTPANASDTGQSGDWEDEIHPSVAGYKKICERLVNPLLREGGTGGSLALIFICNIYLLCCHATTIIPARLCKVEVTSERLPASGQCRLMRERPPLHFHQLVGSSKPNNHDKKALLRR